MSLPTHSDGEALPATEWNQVINGVMQGNVGSLGTSSPDLGAAVNAILATKDTVYVGPGAYTLLTPITVPAKKSVILDASAIITVAGDVNVFNINYGGRVEGGFVDTRGIAYTSAIVNFVPQPSGTFVGRERTIARDIKAWGNIGTGTGTFALLHANVATYAIYGALIENCRISGYEYGFRLKRSIGGSGSTYVNGNDFLHCWLYATVNWLSMESNTTADRDLDGNRFIGIDNQYAAGSSATGTVQGAFNLLDVLMWDYPGATAAVTFSADSTHNYATIRVANENNITNNGVQNQLVLPVQATIKPTFLDAGQVFADIYYVNSGGAIDPKTGASSYLLRARDNADTPEIVARVIGGGAPGNNAFYIMHGPYSSKTITGALANTDQAVEAVGGAGGITLTLPDASANKGLIISVIKTDAAAGAVTLACTGGQTINGAATKVLAAQYDKVQVRSTGTQWLIY